MAKNTLLQDVIAEAKQMKEMAIADAKQKMFESISPEIKAILEAKLNEDMSDEDEPQDDEPKVDEGLSDTAKAMWDKIKSAVKDPVAAKKAWDEWCEKYCTATLSGNSEAKEVAPEEDKEPKEDEAFDIEAALKEVEAGQIKEDGEDAPDADDAAKDDEKPAEDAPVADDEDEIDEDYISKIMAEVEDAEPDEDADDVKEIKEPKEEGEPEEELEEGAIEDILVKAKSLPADLKKSFDAWWAKNSPEAMKDPKNRGVKLPSNREAKEVAPEEAEEEKVEEQLLELKTELQEMNVLNAKLMFQNKLMLSENFSDTQKARIIVAFDKAKTVREAKLIFESLNVTKKVKAAVKPISEGLGFNFKANKTYVAPTNNTISYDNTDPIVKEMQKRAGIIK